MLTVRRAAPDDADAIGRIHVDAWRAAYQGHMPEAYLEGLSPEERAEGWRRGLSRTREGDPVLVVELDGAVVGFASLGPAGYDPATGELYAINLAPEHWGRGAGRELLGSVREELERLGFAEAVLWVHPANRRARRFYEVDGWVADGSERSAEVQGVVVDEVRYRRPLVHQGDR
jgi:L-amino acid N-acyltransferase YncA